MLDIGIITTATRGTLRTSLPSLRNAGFHGRVKIFAEPGEYYIKDENFELIVAEEQLGCFKNYHRAFSTLAEGEADHILVLSDDFIYNRHTFMELNFKIEQTPEFGFISLFTPAGNAHLVSDGWSTVNLGWGNAWGGLYVFNRKVAQKVLNHTFYRHHLNKYPKNQQIDHCIPEVCHQLELDQWYHSPSLSDHIGYNSTIGHKHKWSDKGLKFVK